MSPRRVLILLPAVLLSMLMFAPAASASPTFADMAGTTHEASVTALADEGIVNGCRADRFCARDEITRGQAATMEEVFTRFNPNDEHGRTSPLTEEQLRDLVE